LYKPFSLTSLVYIVLLILAAEAVFILPFVLQRVFRPTVLETFNITNEQIGYCFSVYGIVALFSYFFGGPLADRFQPKNLMAIALILTAMGGFYFASYPDYKHLKILYGYWGFTTIFLFWAPMIKATRMWGGRRQQGQAFGFLDGGRGLVAAVFGSLGVFIFSSLMMGSDIDLSLEIKRKAFKQVILSSSFVVGSIGILVFLFLKTGQKGFPQYRVSKLNNLSWQGIKTVLKLPAIWLLMIIILCAYTAYKATDLFSLYANTVMKYNDIDAAKVGTTLLYIRPLIGIFIGFMADKSKPSLWLMIGFLLTIMASFIFATDFIDFQQELLFFINIVFMAIGVYSCRVLYFATMEEANIPLGLTGTAVGLASIVGYTPDIFSGPMFGILVDNPDGILGLQHAFKVVAAFAVIGFMASYLLLKISRRTSAPDEVSA
jgi:sugar phosphate permease